MESNIEFIFISLKTSIPREVLRRVLENGVSVACIRAIQDMYANAVTTVRTIWRNRSLSDHHWASPRVGEQPVSICRVNSELTRRIQENVPWCMLFADDAVVVNGTKEDVCTKLEYWRNTLESKGFKLSKTKAECMGFQVRPYFYI
jgi:hypothetical protein